MSDEDYAKLSGALVRFAQQMLQRHGEFYPFAATMALNGDVAQVGGDIGQEQPASQSVIAFLQRALASQARSGAIRACGICLNTRARLPGYKGEVDAICCRLEHVEADPVQIFVPMKKNWLGRWKYGGPVPLPGQTVVFSA